MKIRQGFVSNSSSSSFLIMGTVFESDEFLNLTYFKNKYESYCEKEGIECEFESDDFEEFVRDDFYLDGLDVENMYDYGSGEYYVGLSYSEMKGDETLNQFRLRTKQTLNDVLGVKVEHVSWMQECWRDG